MDANVATTPARSSSHCQNDCVTICRHTGKSDLCRVRGQPAEHGSLRISLDPDESEYVLGEREPGGVSVEHGAGGWWITGRRSMLEQRGRKLGNGAQCGVDPLRTEGSGHRHPWLEGVQTTTLETSHHVDTEIALVAVREDHEPFARDRRVPPAPHGQPALMCIQQLAPTRHQP